MDPERKRQCSKCVYITSVSDRDLITRKYVEPILMPQGTDGGKVIDEIRIRIEGRGKKANRNEDKSKN